MGCHHHSPVCLRQIFVPNVRNAVNSFLDASPSTSRSGPDGDTQDRRLGSPKHSFGTSRARPRSLSTLPVLPPSKSARRRHSMGCMGTRPLTWPTLASAGSMTAL